MMSLLTAEQFAGMLAANPEIASEFVANPKPTLAALGFTFPDAVDVHVIETGPNDLTMIFGTQDMYSAGELAAMPPQMSAVLKRTFSDPGFRMLLLRSPVEAIFLETGYRVPDSVNVRAFENTAKDVYFELPVNAVQNDSDELNDLELEQVAGGKGAGAASLGNFLTSAIPASAQGVMRTLGRAAPNGPDL